MTSPALTNESPPSALDTLRARLDELAAIDYGWLDGEGAPPTPASISLAWSVLSALVGTHGVERPRVFPCVEGCVQAEWVIGDWALDAWFAPSGLVVKAGATNARTQVSIGKRWKESPAVIAALLYALILRMTRPSPQESP
jgi:hypothetical protein